MSSWTPKVEEELTLVIKDWLKQHGKTQADLRKELEAESSRMPALIDVLRRDFSKGGLPKIALRLCSIEANWNSEQLINSKAKSEANPFGQLDMLLQEIKEDCE